MKIRSNRSCNRRFTVLDTLFRLFFTRRCIDAAGLLNLYKATVETNNRMQLLNKVSCKLICV